MDKLIPLCKNTFKDSKVAAAKELRLEDSRRYNNNCYLFERE